MIITKIEEYILEGDEIYNLIEGGDGFRNICYSELLDLVRTKLGHVDDLIESRILSSDSVYVKIPRVTIERI